MNLYEEIERIKKDGYGEADAQAKLGQDIVLKAIAESGMAKNVTIKGGVVMRCISKDSRRATQDLDLDFIRYPISDDAIRDFIERLNCINGLTIRMNGKIRVVYHNDLEESLIVNASKVIDLIYQMYLKAKISYEHDIRVEEYPFAREAIREAVYNAIAHNCYMYGTPIQIRVMDDAITISNSCILPEGWTVDTLMEPHESKPYNPDIARVFYRAGFIENWGQGIQKICDECQNIGAELPVYELTGTTLRIRFKALESALVDQTKVPKDQPDTLGDTLADRIIALLKEDPSMTQDTLAEKSKVSVPSIKRTMKILSDSGRIVRKGGKRYGYWEVK